MSTSMLLLVIFVLTAVAYVVGRSRAATLRKNATTLNSLPRYYGYLTAIWTALPALALLALWSVLEPSVLKAGTVNTLPAEIQSLSSGKLNLVLNDIKTSPPVVFRNRRMILFARLRPFTTVP